MVSIIHALNNLLPGNQWSVNGSFGDEDFHITCHTGNVVVPGQQAIQTKMIELALINSKKEKAKEIDLFYAGLKTVPIAYTGHNLPCDILSRAFYNNALQTLDNIFSLNLVTADNVSISLNKLDFMNINLAIRNRDVTLSATAKQRKDALNSLTLLADVLNFVP